MPEAFGAAAGPPAEAWLGALQSMLKTPLGPLF